MYLKATAKINLSLDVLRKRPDGYHDVRMIMQKVGMYDRVNLEPVAGKSGITLETNLTYIPKDTNNLAAKAAKLLMDEFEVTDGLHIRLEKFIPVAAGLAGGSSDAACAMIGVNRLFKLGLSKQELMKRGAAIGADVPYCILGGTALSEGIGDVLTPLPPLPDAWILLCKPNINVSTKDVYGNLRLDGTIRHPDVDGMITALENGDLTAVADAKCMGNVLESVTGEKYPVIGNIEDMMKNCGALGAVMSGSGPTVFGIFDSQEKAEQCRAALRKRYPASRVFLTWPEQEGRRRYDGQRR